MNNLLRDVKTLMKAILMICVGIFIVISTIGMSYAIFHVSVIDTVKSECINCEWNH